MSDWLVPWQALIDAAPEGVVILDAEGAVHYANTAALTLLGLDAPAGQPLESWLVELSEIKRDLLLKAAQEKQQTRLYEPNAEHQFLMFEGRPLPGKAGGTLVHVQCDHTAKAANLIAIAVHELRLPMTSITGYTKMLKTVGAESLNDMQRQFIDTIIRNIERMNIDLTALQDMSCVDRGRVNLEPGPMPVLSTIQSVLAECQALVEEKEHQVSVESAAAALPSVHADRGRFMQILQILLDNALKYTPNGGQIRVHIQVVDNWVQIDVADNGPGIPQSEQDKIFEKFFRGEDDAIRAYPGLGLGAYIARGLAELQGGSLWFETTAGEGCTFSFTLPVYSNIANTELVG